VGCEAQGVNTGTLQGTIKKNNYCDHTKPYSTLLSVSTLAKLKSSANATSED